MPDCVNNFVIQRPWSWLGIALAAVSVTGWLVVLWDQRRTRRRIAHIAEPLVDICRRGGFDNEAEQIQRDLDSLRGEFRLKVVIPHGGDR